MSDLGISLDHLHISIDWLEKFPPWLRQMLQKLTDAVNRALNSIPSVLASWGRSLAHKAQELLNKIGDLCVKLGDWIAKNIWPVIKGPFTLYDAGNRWVTDVFRHVTAASGTADPGVMVLQRYWTGDSAAAYFAQLARQKGATERLSKVASGLRELLHGLAIKLAVLYLAVVALLILAAAKLTGGVAAALTAIGIPAALAAWIAALIEAIGGAAAIWGGGIGIAAWVGEQAGKLLELKNDETFYSQQGGTWMWPSATTGVGDNPSLKDSPDDTSMGWNVKRQFG